MLKAIIQEKTKSVSVAGSKLFGNGSSDNANTLGADSSGNVNTSNTELTESTNSNSANSSNGASTTKETSSSEQVISYKPEKLSIMMVGDDLLHVPVSNSGRMSNGKWNYDHMFAHVKKDAKKADLSIINEEVILGGESLGITGYPTFNGRYEVGDAIAKAGFNMILHATNHSMDRSRAGIFKCLGFWKKNYPKIQVTGMYTTKKQYNKITYFKKNGITVAVLNYTYGTNGIPLPSDMPYAVNLLSKEKVKRDVTLAKKHADFIMVCPHWGTEYNLGTDALQQQWSKYFLKLGVDLVIGTHPHVVEPVKWLKDKKGHKMLVYYSLGNFINSSSLRGQNVRRQYYGGMAKVKLQRNTKNGQVKIAKASFVPLITQWPGNGKITTYKVKDYKPAMVTQNRLHSQDPYFSMQDMTLFFQKEIGAKFLSRY